MAKTKKLRPGEIGCSFGKNISVPQCFKSDPFKKLADKWDKKLRQDTIHKRRNKGDFNKHQMFKGGPDGDAYQFHESYKEYVPDDNSIRDQKTSRSVVSKKNSILDFTVLNCIERFTEEKLSPEEMASLMDGEVIEVRLKANYASIKVNDNAELHSSYSPEQIEYAEATLRHLIPKNSLESYLVSLRMQLSPKVIHDAQLDLASELLNNYFSQIGILLKDGVPYLRFHCDSIDLGEIPHTFSGTVTPPLISYLAERKPLDNDLLNKYIAKDLGDFKSNRLTEITIDDVPRIMDMLATKGLVKSKLLQTVTQLQNQSIQVENISKILRKEKQFKNCSADTIWRHIRKCLEENGFKLPKQRRSTRKIQNLGNLNKVG